MTTSSCTPPPPQRPGVSAVSPQDKAAQADGSRTSRSQDAERAAVQRVPRGCRLLRPVVLLSSILPLHPLEEMRTYVIN